MIQSSQKRENNMVLVKEPHEFIRGKYKLSAFALKILSFLFSKIDPFQDEPFQKYEISVQEIKEIYGKNYGDIYSVVKNTFRNLIDIKIELEDEDEWKIFTIIVDPTILKRNGTISFFISPNLLQLLKKSKHFLKYDISILAYFNSAYSVRLYKLLKDRLEINKKFNHQDKYLIELEEFKNLLQIPKSYIYGDIKRKVLTPALKEINEYSDIKVDFEEIKKGRKVEKLAFSIEYKIITKDKKAPLRKTAKKSPGSNKDATTTLPGEIKDLKAFRESIIQKYNNKDKYFIIGTHSFKIKENLLFVNDEALKASEALTWWSYIYKNRDKIQEIDPVEAEKQAIQESINKLNEIYSYRNTIILIGDEYKEVEIIKITGEDLENLTIYFKDPKTKKVYQANYSLRGLKNLFS